MMGFHREGRMSLFLATVVALILTTIAWMIMMPIVLALLLTALAAFLFLIILQFFRKPDRTLQPKDGVVFAPADGKVVVIEKTFEDEYLQEERIQVSIFMSPLNVHINWYPISGIVKYFKYHPGKYLVAWHPKSSTLNERTTMVVENKSVSVLVRQIAGAMARRIVCYAKEGEQVTQGTELGFIKFGSRVDIFLPLDSEVAVALDQKVQGNRTVLARVPGSTTS